MKNTCAVTRLHGHVSSFFVKLVNMALGKQVYGETLQLSYQRLQMVRVNGLLLGFPVLFPFILTRVLSTLILAHWLLLSLKPLSFALSFFPVFPSGIECVLPLNFTGLPCFLPSTRYYRNCHLILPSSTTTIAFASFFQQRRSWL